MNGTSRSSIETMSRRPQASSNWEELDVVSEKRRENSLRFRSRSIVASDPDLAERLNGSNSLLGGSLQPEPHIIRCLVERRAGHDTANRAQAFLRLRHGGVLPVGWSEEI
jgi:hypothetical protein